jgi:hypothetical protein
LKRSTLRLHNRPFHSTACHLAKKRSGWQAIT